MNFIAGLLAYTISGSISNGSAGLSGVTVTIGDAYSTNTVTSTNGLYWVSGLCPGTYAVTPSLTGFAFDPGSANITVGPDATTVSFLATPIFNISGRVTEGGNGVSGVSVTAGTNNAPPIPAATILSSACAQAHHRHAVAGLLPVHSHQLRVCGLVEYRPG